VVIELLALSRMFGWPYWLVGEEEIQRPSAAGEVGQRALSATHMEEAPYPAIQSHWRCSVHTASIRSVYKENISELRQTGLVSSKDVTHRSRDLWHRIRAMCELSVLCHKRKVEREESQREEMSKKEMSREFLILTDVHPTVKRMKEGGGECNEAGYL
jgi:hypothetical protein